ncbi:MAG: nucleotide-diphospho-sugar transferase [Bacteriovoracaceae bacterium]|nr:nucleotide-diphospho-sugar transferase [Bacteriovoracaceae bacterium]
MQSGFQTPILFLIFNRDDTAQAVFNEIKKQSPKYLYVAADGPRVHKAGEAENCRRTRAIIDQVDWDCEVKTLFRESNLGCGRAVSEAITWFFNNVEKGIILEDDCLPDPSFFSYMEELLLKYENDERVSAISGDNFIAKPLPNNESYFFGIYHHIWGWASWRRAWNGYDLKMTKWVASRDSGLLEKIFADKAERAYWTNILNACSEDKIDTWDYQWTFNCWNKEALVIHPNVNMVKNIGFDDRATHTKDDNGFSLEVFKMNFPLKHPLLVERNKKLEKAMWEKSFKPQGRLSRIVRKIFK